MPTEQQMDHLIDSWLSSTNDSPHDADLTVARVMARVPQTRQRRRWWPGFLGRRASGSPDAVEPDVDGRTRTRVSGASLAAGALVVAAVSAVLIVQPFDRGDDSEPAVEIPATSAGPLAAARQLHTATDLGDGRVLVIGGKTSLDGPATAAIAEAEMWDPVSGEFLPAGSTTEARYGHTATRLDDGRVVVIGGYGNDGAWLDSAELWDPESGTFSPAGTLGVGRHAHAATLLPDGRVLVTGGYGGEWAWLTSSEIWDPESGTFSPSGDLAEARWEHDAVLLPDGRVLVVGGAEAVTPRTLVEVWDPESGTFASAGDLEQGRTSHSTTVLEDGRVLVAGGNPGGEPWELASVELWDPTTSSVGPSEPLAIARHSHTGTLLPSGDVLIIGGTNSEGALSPAELWDADTGSFEMTDIVVEQYEHTATLLPDGRVLTVGGLVDGQQAADAAELVDPEADAE